MGKFLWIFSRTLIGTTVNKTPYSYHLKPINLFLSKQIIGFNITQVSSRNNLVVGFGVFRKTANLLDDNKLILLFDPLSNRP